VSTIAEQSALLGAIDVAKNKCPKGNIFAEDTMVSLDLIAATNFLAYSNIMKWNNGKWALEGNLNDYLESVDSMSEAQNIGSPTTQDTGKIIDDTKQDNKITAGLRRLLSAFKITKNKDSKHDIVLAPTDLEGI
jgi:hypothetical protein